MCVVLGWVQSVQDNGLIVLFHAPNQISMQSTVWKLYQKHTVTIQLLNNFGVVVLLLLLFASL